MSLNFLPTVTRPETIPEFENAFAAEVAGYLKPYPKVRFTDP